MTQLPEVYAAHAWRTNGELIADVARLHLRPDMRTIDPTHGRGKWWTVWRPDELVAHDKAIDGVDFRALPYPTSSFDLGAYDPPYVAVGGLTKHEHVARMHASFGLRYRKPADLQSLIEDGLAEVARVVRPGGLILAKCQDYVSGGRLWPGSFLTLAHAYAIGLELVDRFDHLNRGRPQPQGRSRKATATERKAGLADAEGRMATVQVHARRRPSTLYVLRKLPPASSAPAPMAGQLALLKGGVK